MPRLIICIKLDFFLVYIFQGATLSLVEYNWNRSFILFKKYITASVLSLGILVCRMHQPTSHWPTTALGWQEGWVFIAGRMFYPAPADCKLFKLRCLLQHAHLQSNSSLSHHCPSSQFDIFPIHHLPQPSASIGIVFLSMALAAFLPQIPNYGRLWIIKPVR